MPRTSLSNFLPLCAAIAANAVLSTSAFAQEKVRLGWCTSVITFGVAPIAVATKLGWFKKEGIDVELVNLPGSSDCVRNVATGEVLVAVPSAEPVAILRQTGVETKIFYTAFRRNIFGVAVPKDSPIKSYADLKGKSIGVTSMASSGVVVARSAAGDAGLDPDRDIKIVVSGMAAQSAMLLQRGEIAAVSQWDTQYTLMGLAGVPMRMLDNPELASFPANSFVAKAETIKSKRKLLVALARAYTMGVVYTIKNPRKASEIFLEVYPQAVPTGMTSAAALDRTTTLLTTVAANWPLEKPVEKWGESNLKVYQTYLDWLKKNNILKQPLSASAIVTNELVDEINTNLDLRTVEQALAR